MFGRRKSQPPADGITEFWTWWDEARHRIAAAIDRRTPLEMTDEINQRVHAIHPNVDWELAPGRGAQHALIVSPVGRAKLRALVARWLAAAPPPDAVWEYHGARQPDPNVVTARLEFEGHQVDLGELRFATSMDDDHNVVDVVVFHPAFAGLAEEHRVRISFMSLDWILGEERVEAWVGAIEHSLTLPATAGESTAMIAMVDALAESYREPMWKMLQGTRNNAPITAMTQQPLRPIRWPRFDTHVAVVLPYVDRGDGLPTGASLDQVRAAEDRLTERIGSDGELLAHETTGGLRTLHYYLDGSSPAPAAIKDLAATLKAKTSETYDPDLDQVRHLS